MAGSQGLLRYCVPIARFCRRQYEQANCKNSGTEGELSGEKEQKTSKFRRNSSVTLNIGTLHPD